MSAGQRAQVEGTKGKEGHVSGKPGCLKIIHHTFLSEGPSLVDHLRRVVKNSKYKMLIKSIPLLETFCKMSKIEVTGKNIKIMPGKCSMCIVGGILTTNIAS